MAFEKNFSNTVVDRRNKKREITKLTELTEDDRNTIFNLIFPETGETAEEKPEE